jgi:class 3 adenylate cyclase
MLDDDKGVHLVAAVNLAESIPECSLVGLEICRELITKQVGCVIGMASGSTFCGVVGSSNIACRWDIAGSPPVRAARLMQYALLSDDCNVAIDQSVYDDPIAFTRMTLFDPCVNIKGALAPIPIYTLSNCQSSVAFRVLETVHGTNQALFLLFIQPFLIFRLNYRICFSPRS